MGAATAGKGGGQAQPPNMFQQSAAATTGGMLGAAGEMGYQPMMVNPGAFNVNAQQIDPNAAQWQAAQTQQEDISRFYNPYTSQVIDTSMQDIERARLMQSNQAAAQAQAAGAFGGSRGALMEAEIGRNALDQAARTAAGLRSQGFSQAAQLSQQDVARRQQANQSNAMQQLQALLANQQAGLQAGSTNAQLGLQASMANQAAGLAGSQQRLAAGGQLANIGNLGFGQAQSALSGMQQQGALQQALQQRLMDAGRQQWGGYQQAPTQGLAGLVSAVGGVPIPTSTRTSESPGLLDILQTGASIAAASDRNLKDNIKRVGVLPNGLGIYTWRWKDAAKALGIPLGPTVGVIAQEVQKVMPDAVKRHDSGYLMVNYGAIA